MSPWSALWAVSFVLLGVHLLPREILDAGVFCADALQRGEGWRWVSAHWIHRSDAHLLFNVGSWWLSFWLLHWLVPREPRWVWGLVPVGLCISWSVACCDPAAPPFVGFSALVYASLVAGAVIGLATLRGYRVCIGLLIALVGKLCIELQTDVSLGVTTLWQEVRVAHQVHALALVWGGMWGLGELGWREFRRTRDSSPVKLP